MDILLSNGKVAIIDDADYPLVAPYRWHHHQQEGKKAYAQGWVSPPEGGKKKCLKMHHVLTGWPFVDHIDGDGLNNRRGNMRPATTAQNARNRGPTARNRGPTARNRSGYKGVVKRHRKYVANIQADGKQTYLGSADTPEEAARLYNTAAKELHGDFAYQNDLTS